MGQFALSADGTKLAVLTNGDARYVDLTAEAVPNSTLYPVDAYGDSGPTPFTLNLTPKSRAIAPGGTARYQIALAVPVGYPIALTYTNPAPDALATTLEGNISVLPPTLALVVQDIYSPATAMLPRAYTIPITATGGGFTRTAQARLLVGGARVYLPLVMKTTR
jgi:hypothetical protein